MTSSTAPRHTVLDDHDLRALRRQIAREAASAARPRLWLDTISAVAVTGWRAVTVAAPDAPLALLTAVGAASGLPIAPPSSSRGTIERAERLVREGGPAYIKLGQFIASARGLLPDPWVDAFGWCRDDAPPLPYDVVAGIVERELGPDVLALEEEPLAAGSIGQVHRATLADGTRVVVKVRRPGLRRRLQSDIQAFALLAAGAPRVLPAAQAANLSGFVELFAQLTFEELDFRLEAANLAESAQIHAACGLEFVRVPQPTCGMVTERLLVMEQMDGVPYDRARVAYGDDLDGDLLVDFAIRGVLQTTLLHGLFHGDLHAGNVLVEGGDRFALVDFGICGRLDHGQRAGLAQFLAGFAAADAGAQLRAMQRFGALPADADLDALSAELQPVVDAIEARHDGPITFERLGDALGEMLRLLARHGFTMPKEFVLFFKNLLYLSGFAAVVAPDADLYRRVETVLGELWADHSDELGALMAG